MNFDPSVGTEIRKSRSAVIISASAFSPNWRITIYEVVKS
ncbi:hypothetical protein [Microcoleus sp. herbarium5]